MLNGGGTLMPPAREFVVCGMLLPRAALCVREVPCLLAATCILAAERNSAETELAILVALSASWLTLQRRSGCQAHSRYHTALSTAVCYSVLF